MDNVMFRRSNRLKKHFVITSNVLLAKVIVSLVVAWWI